MSFKSNKYLSISLFLIFLIIAVFFRFWQLDQIPPGLNRDEASIGYTAWSILKTSKDEYGYFMPLSIKSFGDWKLPMSVYLTIPFVALLGLTNWSTRLPFALAGIVTLFFFYFLVKEVFANNKKGRVYALLSLVFLLVLPWHFHFSRYGHEGTIGLLFLTGAVLFLLKGLKKPWFLLIAALFGGLTLYSYYTYFIFTPVFLLGLIFLYLPKLKKHKNLALISFFLFLFLVGIIFKVTFTGTRTKSSISYLTDPATIHSQIEIPRAKMSHSFLARIIYNRPVVFSRLFLTRYFATFLPNFLIIKGGDHPLHNFPGLANIFWFEYPFFLLGLFFLLRKRNKQSLLLFWWLLIAPLGSSLTKDAPNSGRVSPMIIPLVITISIGLVDFYYFIKNKKQKIAFSVLMTVVFGLSLISLYQNYFIDFPYQRVQYWGGGYQKLVNFLNLPENREKKVVTQRPNYSPYIYFLFYSRYNPETYQQEAMRYPPTEDGFYHVKAFSRFQFKDFELENEVNQDQITVIWAETIDQKKLNSLSPFLKATIEENNQPIFYVFEGQASQLKPKAK